MGYHFGAVCDACGHAFDVSHGGGPTFHMLHCHTCGRAVGVSFVQLGDTHRRYVKGLSGPISKETEEEDRRIQREFQGDPLAEAPYHAAVEAFAGSCKCGGRYGLDAPIRCPACRSTRFTKNPRAPRTWYD